MTMNRMKFLLLLSLATSAMVPVTALAQSLPFQITVDGERVDGTKLPAPEGNATDQTTGEKVSVDVKYDGLGVAPILNVSTLPPQVSYAPGSEIRFLASFNYPGYITKAEIRIYKAGTNELGATLPVTSLGAADWVMPEDAPDEMDYVLRVYDADGRYDETRGRTIYKSGISNRNSPPPASAPGYGEDFTAVRNIDVSGGGVTVYGKNIPTDHDVKVMDEPVPTDGSGSFVIQRILPPGVQAVSIAVEKDGEGLNFSRDVEIPETEWFYVGLADLTAGLRLKKEITATRDGEYDKTWARGRLAFYLKGKVKGQYILTAAADTSDQKLKEIFKGLDGKDPREFLRRLDPDDYYPVYGDDSSSVQDAPTQGKFYVRLERGPSHAMWGNFKSNITGTKFLANERALYGASAVYRSKAVVPTGEASTAVDVYAALPGSLPQRDELRATGGSAYFLKFRDITTGSETITIERRNPTTGWVIEARTLKFGDDYAIDYSQGVLILNQPLATNSAQGGEHFVVAAYEYAPAASNVKGYVTGARAQQWVGDHVRVGVTGQKDKTASADQKSASADVRVQATPNTYVEAEVARSTGPGFGKSYSPDGGLTIQGTPTAGVKGLKANAWRVEAQADVADLTKGKSTGTVRARVEKLEKGFASSATQASANKIVWGLEGDVQLTERSKVAATYSESREAGRIDRDGQAKVQVPVSEHVAAEPYVQYQKKSGSGATATDDGSRLNVGSRLVYKWDEDNEGWLFGQATANRTGKMDKDHRAGVGIKKQITDRLNAEVEVSTGSTGFAARSLLSYEPTAESRYYLGYTLEADRGGGSTGSWPFALVGDDLGTVVAGSNVKINDHWSAYGEDKIDMFGKRHSLTQAYGVTYTPNEVWTYTGSFERGDVIDNTRKPDGTKNPDFNRLAVSGQAEYRDAEKLQAKLKAEYRADRSDEANKDVESWLLQAAITAKVSNDWRAIGTMDLVFTDADETARAGKYAEASIGYAYRPTENDKVNALVKYTMLYDNPGKEQVTVDGTYDAAAQRSQIFSADVNYDVNPQLTLGAKYGFRIGEIKEREIDADWTKSSAQLGILRADLHIVHEWDAVAEGRILWSSTTNQKDFGFLVAVYKHLSDNFKLGVGYNFGRFSDDLRDLSLDDKGVFVNVVGTF
jgi:hypothetical protein